MGKPHPSSDSPLVSVIIPARNEEASLAQCLESLASQTGLTFEIIVVDDASTDHTRQIAQTFPQVNVVDAPPLPPGWTGKNNALVAGAKTARGKWLLFTDADTFHHPGSLARSLSEAEQHSAALLSYSPEQEVRGFLENAVMPVIFAELACTYRPSEICNPASRAAAANGQYLLITRQAYDAVRGDSSCDHDRPIAQAYPEGTFFLDLKRSSSVRPSDLFVSFIAVATLLQERTCDLERQNLRFAARPQRHVSSGGSRPRTGAALAPEV